MVCASTLKELCDKVVGTWQDPANILPLPRPSGRTSDGSAVPVIGALASVDNTHRVLVAAQQSTLGSSHRRGHTMLQSQEQKGALRGSDVSNYEVMVNKGIPKKYVKGRF